MTTKAAILKTIRAYCIQCSGGDKTEVKRCTVVKCELYPYRMGKDPNPFRRLQNTSATDTKLGNDEEKCI